jgi:isopentenyldiphosphate isomerase
VATKDICPNLWDLSCAEHLKPGESYHDAAVRGLSEELGIIVDNANGKSLQLLRPLQLFEHVDERQQIKDREFNECYRLIYDTPIVDWQRDEIAALKYVSRTELRQLVQVDSSAFTPWSLKEFRLVNYCC